MLGAIKEFINTEYAYESALELAAKDLAEDSDIRDRFLDNPKNTIMMGKPESDETISELIDKIPETEVETDDEILDKTIEKTIETYIP